MSSTIVTPLSPTDERPLDRRPDISNWTENYCLQAYDPESAFGVWLHVGLPVYDFELWHDFTVIYLPGGTELLVAKGFGSRRGASDVSGSMLTCDYDEASGTWTVRFRGAAQRADREALYTRPAIDGVAEPVAFELRYRGICPVWSLHDQVAGQVWSNAHWEQPCTVDGWVELGGRRREFSGSGIRDHSRGPRDFTHMGPHFWLHGMTPSGRAFGLLHIDPTAGQPRPLAIAYLVQDNRLIEAEIVSLPDDAAFAEPLELVLAGPNEEQRIHGRLLHEMPFTVQYPNEVLFGYRAGKPQHLLREGLVRWEWDGELAYGLGERTVTLAADGSIETR